VLTDFFYRLRTVKIPVSVTEYLTLLRALEARVAAFSVDEFYYLARCTLVKDERYFDRFDQVFGDYIQGKTTLFEEILGEIPLDWLKKQKELNLSEEEKQKIESLGGWDKLMETLKKRLEEQKKAHHGGNKWIGTGGTSPFGNGGYNPQGVRIGGKGGNKSAVKVWEQRAYADYDDTLELGTRNIKVALRRLRRFAREGLETELDLDGTIHGTAANAGLLDIKMIPERHNKVKVLLLMDVGGTMDEHIHRIDIDAGAVDDGWQRQAIIDCLVLPFERAALVIPDVEIMHRARKSMQQPNPVGQLADAPEAGGGLAQPVMPGIEDVERGIDPRHQRRIAVAPHEQQEAREIDDVVALLPGVAQIAVGEPGLERERIEPGLSESQIWPPSGLQRIDRAQAVVRYMPVDVAPGLADIGLLEDAVVIHAGHAEPPIGKPTGFEPGDKPGAILGRPAIQPAQQIKTHDPVVGAGQQHAGPGRLVMEGADPQYAFRLLRRLHGAEPFQRALPGGIDPLGQPVPYFEPFQHGIIP
jgi:hypothetical protein